MAVATGMVAATMEEAAALAIVHRLKGLGLAAVVTADGMATTAAAGEAVQPQAGRRVATTAKTATLAAAATAGQAEAIADG